MEQEWDASGKLITTAAAPTTKSSPAVEWDASGNPIQAPVSKPPAQPGNAFTSGDFLNTIRANVRDATAPLPVPESIAGYLSPSRALKNFGGGAVEGLQALYHILDSSGADPTAKMTPQQRLQYRADSIANQGGQTVANFASDPVGAYARAAGQQAPGLIAGAGVADLVPAIAAKIPSRARAGAAFQALNQNLAEQPVQINAAAKALQRATEIGGRGSTLPKAVSDLLTRSQSIEPMTFPEARDYQASLSDLSTSDKLAMNGRMRGAVAQLNKHLFSDIYDAADASGQGPQYAQAMKEYRQASQFRNAAKTTGKVAIGAAGAGGLYRYLKDVLQ